jgi:hypothetical protein
MIKYHKKRINRKNKYGKIFQYLEDEILALKICNNKEKINVLIENIKYKLKTRMI